MSGRSRYILRRVAGLVPLLLAVLFVVFSLLQITPGDPARAMAGHRSTLEEVAEVRTELGLDRPFFVQYVSYVVDAAQGDLGTSVRSRTPVTEIITSGIPLSLTLIMLGSGLAMLIATPLAWWSATRRDRFADHAIRAYSTVTLAVPMFWTGIVLLTAVALPTGWFPVTGYGGTLAERARALVLPSVTIAIAQAPLVLRGLRAEFLRIQESDYIAVATASGVTGLRRLLRHEVPNALVPAVSLMAVSVPYMLFGIVVVETTFGLPGIGQAVTMAVNTKDFPVVQGVTLIFALVTVTTYLIADIVYTLIDPRIELR
jgi:peptide/nickel transport system permease protein